MEKLILKILGSKITQTSFLCLCVITFFVIFYLIIAAGEGTMLWLKLKVVQILGFKISDFE